MISEEIERLIVIATKQEAQQLIPKQLELVIKQVLQQLGEEEQDSVIKLRP